MGGTVLQDLRQAIRQVRHAPGFAAAVVLTLTLAIGANTALFSLVNALLLRTLPVKEPDRLVLLQATDVTGRQNRPIYYSAYAELARLRAFDSLALYSSGGLLQTEARGVPGEGLIEAATPGFHEMLGLRPHVGRFFTADDSPADAPAAAVAVISHDFWMRYFGGDPQAIGETLMVSGSPVTVIGVTPPEYKGFYFEGGYGFSVPLTVLNRQLSTTPERPVRGLNAVGRLAPGVAISEARAAVLAAWSSVRAETVPPGLAPIEQQEIPTYGMRLDSIATGFSGLRTRYAEPLRLLTGVSAVLLLIGCVNISGLLLARTAARNRQFAVRLALGASRWRLARQLLVEGLLLSIAGAVAGVLVAWWATRLAAVVLWQGSSPMVHPLTPDAQVLGVTAMVSVATGLLIGVVPAWRAGRTLPLASLQPERSVTRGTSTWSKALLATQVSLSLILLVGAGLFVSSLANLRHLDAGFRGEGLRFSRLFAVPGGYRDLNDTVYYPTLVARLSDVPGVTSVALAGSFPTFFGMGHLVRMESIARTDASEATAEGMLEYVTPRFFDTAGIPLRRGRDFTWSDDGEHPRVVILSESLSGRLFPDGDAIGRHINIGNNPERRALEVVGIAGNAAIGAFRAPDVPVVFLPRMQELQFARAPVLLFRSSGDPAALDGAMTGVIRSLGHEYPRRFYALDEHTDRALSQERLLAWLSSFFALLAVLLSALGVFGLLAYGVARRVREIGIRMAVGASRARVLRLVVGEGLALTVAGVGVGVPCALAAGGLARSLLFDVQPRDPVIVAAAALGFIAVGALAGLWPAYRASTVDPMVALRAE